MQTLVVPRRLALVPLVVAALAVTGCDLADPGAADAPDGRSGVVGGDSEDRDDDASEELAGVAGVAEVWVGEVEVDDGVVEREAHVDLRADVTVEETVEVLEVAHDLDAEPAVTLGAGGLDEDVEISPDEYVVLGGASDDPARRAEAARLLVAAASVIGDDGGAAVTVSDVVEPADRVRLTLYVRGTGPADVTTVAERVVADPELVDSGPQLYLTAGGSTESTTSTIFTVDDVLTAAQVRGWDELGPLPVSTSDDVVVSRTVTAAADGSLEVYLDFEVGGDYDYPAERVTTRTWGDELWPVLRPALDTLDDLPPGSSVRAYPGDPTLRESIFMDVDRDGAAARDLLGRTWNAEAERYLRR